MGCESSGSARPDGKRSAGRLRGHPIYWDGEQYRYVDDDSPAKLYWMKRACGACGLAATPEGHDGCLGTLPGVMNACCGHGDVSEAYVQFRDGRPRVAGLEALEEQRRLGGCPPRVPRVVELKEHDRRPF